MTNLPGTFDFTPSKGWMCPKCSAVMSPSYPTCFYCKPENDEKAQVDRFMAHLGFLARMSTIKSW